ncbi:hypothetical protein [Peribacillus deserti]|uniref:Uncharacterized protein n=1 Tax=Peribacillus deserti TaxID=673318 RepID=A0A2N5M424_9BACI|nr:hypothetical protein [Peribacillus deserti]PLT29082.1 hypothetical protein CUU66_14785 [Peribacillus deserti]
MVWKRILTVSTITVLFLGFRGFYLFKWSHSESGSIKGFPVPKGADLTKDKKSVQEYYWSFASEENGLPEWYEMTISYAAGI